MTELVLAVDIGGTKIAAALVDGDGGVHDRVSAPTPGAAGPAAIVCTIVALADELHARQVATLCGVGVATAGVVDATAGTIVSSTDTLTDWAGTRLRDLVREALGERLVTSAPIAVLNDADAAALGEYHHGAARGVTSALTVAVGTGVGGGLVLDGRIRPGARHSAGEIAHMPTPGAEHLRCPCGRIGHLEAIGGGVGLHRHFVSLGGDPRALDARDVAARAGDDALARQAIADSAAAVGRAIAGAVTVVDPDVVVVTGGVARIGPLWWIPLEESFRATVIDVFADLELRPSVLGDDAPLRGAADAAWAQTKVFA